VPNDRLVTNNRHASGQSGGWRRRAVCIPSLLVKSDGISRVPGQRDELRTSAASRVARAGRPDVEQDGVSGWLSARFDAGSDAVIAGLVAVWLQLGVGWIVHTVCLVSVAGAAAIMCLVKTRLSQPNRRIPSLLVIGTGV
jgi:hypothetical protein